jgi:hypothetical protein
MESELRNICLEIGNDLLVLKDWLGLENKT